jgi:hypothetical protein
METAFIICAAVGGTLLVCQFLLAVLGIGDHHDTGGHDLGGHDVGGHDVGHAAGDHGHDVGHDSSINWFVSMLTFRTLMAGLTFFGLMGLIGCRQDWPAPISLGAALVAGAGAFLLVGWLMRALYRLRSEGTVRIERAVGLSGSVYLTIPGQRKGVGKIHISLQNRTVEYQAITSHDQLPTGAPVRIVAVINSDTVEVAPVDSPVERVAHV